MKKIHWGMLLAGMCVLLPVASVRGKEPERPAWVEPMKKVHGKFKGTKGTFAHFGDSITVTMAFWAPLAQPPQKMDAATAKDHELVTKYMKPECWNKWKGPEHGSNGGMTIRWAHDNIDKWLKKHNPEAALIMFGTNDLGQLGLKEYEQKTREVVRRCLDNGTVVILSTIPPFHGRLEQSRKFAETVRKIAEEEKVPLLDYFGEVLKRRPDDWDGALPKFKAIEGGTYDVPTLISRDGVHPSYPSKYKDFSEESLSRNGYGLRSYLTLRSYAGVIRQVFEP
jgi:hypothetical protein